MQAPPSNPEEDLLSGSAPSAFFHGPAMQHNMHGELFSRVLGSIVQGTACGILGLNSIAGLVFFIITSAILLFASAVVIGFDTTKYFPNFNTWLTHGFSQSATTFLLFWTMVYNVVHIY